MSDHLSYSEDVDIPTRVKIIIDRKLLYDYKFNDTRLENLLEQLMRRYPGIFSYTVPVDEQYLASKCGLQIPALRELLYSLSVLHLIKYVPASHDSVILLHHSRLMPGNLDLRLDKYKFLRDNYIQRSEAIIEYASETNECRSRHLLRYFGQEESCDCGQCDICRGDSGKSDNARKLERYRKLMDNA